MNDRESLVGTCGLDCGICELYQTRDNPQLLERMVQSGIPPGETSLSRLQKRSRSLPSR